jgi:hypothetical protein
MDKLMSTSTKMDVMNKLRSRYTNAGRKHRSKLIDQAVDLMGYHRKAAIRALASPPPRPRLGPSGGRPIEYDSKLLSPALKVIWRDCDFPCALRLAAMLPEWIPAYESYKKDDNAHVEQKNWTHIRQWFGYERYENPEVVEAINTMVRGPWSQLLNYFHASLKLEKKENGKRIYGVAQTPLARVLASEKITPETKERLTREKTQLNPFELKARVKKQLQAIDTGVRPESNLKTKTFILGAFLLPTLYLYRYNKAMNPTIVQLSAQRDALLKELNSIDRLRRGSLSQQVISRRQGDHTIIQGPYFNLQGFHKGKKFNSHIPADKAQEVRLHVQNFKRFQELADECITLTDQITQMAEGLDDAKKNSRPQRSKKSSSRKHRPS